MSKTLTQQEEVKANSEIFFKELLPQLLNDNLQGQYALMHNGKIESILKDFHDAVIMGNKLYRDSPFSVQEITSEPINLGSYSYKHK